MTKRFHIKKQLWFQKKNSTAHAVISPIENIEKAIDNNFFFRSLYWHKKSVWYSGS